MKQWILEYSATYSHCKSSTVWICVTFSVDFVETPRLALLVRFGQVPIESTALPLMQRTDNTVSISILVDFCLQISWFKMILKSKMIKNMSPISTQHLQISSWTSRLEKVCRNTTCGDVTGDTRRSLELYPRCPEPKVSCVFWFSRVVCVYCVCVCLFPWFHCFLCFCCFVFTFRLRSFLDKAYSCYWKAIPVFRLQWLMDVQLCKDARMGEN